MELSLFEQVGELVRALAPADPDAVSFRAHRRGVKVWLDSATGHRADRKRGRETAPPTHFEAQVIPRRLVDGRDGMVLEVGFHTEHRDEQENTAVLRALLDAEQSWRRDLGEDAEAGPFLGRNGWGRLSELWFDPDLDDPDLPMELAARLADYLGALAPLDP